MFSIFNPKTSNTLSITESDHSAPIKPGQTILDAAISAGIKFPNMCNVGECGSCRCQLIEGEVKLNSDISRHVDSTALQLGYILACQSQAHSDVKVRVPGLSKGDLGTKRFKARITKQQSLSDGIQRLELELDSPIQYIPGQYAQLDIEGLGMGRPRNYSFATPGDKKGSTTVSFFIRHVPGGEFTDWLFEKNRVDSNIQLSGPFGDFCFKGQQPQMVCIAAGSGLAPILAILKQLQNEPQPPRVKLIVAAAEQKDLYLQHEIIGLQSSWHNKFEYIPVLSRETESTSWRGLRGRVGDLLDGMTLGLTNSEAYLCGPPAMLDQLIEQLQSEIPEKHIHYDRFYDRQSLRARKDTNLASAKNEVIDHG